MRLGGKRTWSEKYIFCHGQRNSQWVIILINTNVDPIVQTDHQGRCILKKKCYFKLEQKQIWLIICGPNNDDSHFFFFFKKILSLQATNASIIMVGDYITVLSTPPFKSLG
jgi:uncharacterized membrane protein